MNRIDRELLEFCRDDFRSLRDLRGRIPGGTLYRHASKLVRLGWLAKEGALLGGVAFAASGRDGPARHA